MNVLAVSAVLADQDRLIPPMPGLVIACFVCEGLIALAALLAFVFLGSEAAPDFLKVGNESNLPTWFSSSQFLLVGLALTPLAVRDIRSYDRGTWALALVLFLYYFLSLDEAAMIHERLGDWFQFETGVGASTKTGPWMLVFLPLVAVPGLLALRALWPYLRGRMDVLGLLALGAVALGVCAVGFELLGNLVASGSLAQKALGFAEEVGEMMATTCMLWGALRLLEHEGICLELGDSAP